MVGSENHGGGVTAYSWERFPRQFNVGDFDVVILNFATLAEDAALATEFGSERLPSAESLGRLIFGDGTELIVVGDPSTLVGPESARRGYALTGRSTVSDCLPIWCRVEHQRGTQVVVVEKEWDFYFSQLSAYEWFRIEVGLRYEDPTYFFKAIGISGADMMQASTKPLAETRSGQQIAFGLKLFAVRRVEPSGLVITYGAEETRPLRSFSPVYWLPALDEASASESVDLILLGRFGIPRSDQRPDWIDDYALPVEAEIGIEIAGLRREIRTLEARIAEARDGLERAGAPKALLFEKGKDGLEPVVRRALGELGAEVTMPEREGIEDGVLRRGPDAAVIEIKGRKDQIRLGDLRQAVQWAEDAGRRDGVAYKPIVVGNAHCETRPTRRGRPFGPNALDYARNNRVALLTTVQVYEALVQRQRGEFDDVAFWQRVFAADGLVEPWSNALSPP